MSRTPASFGRNLANLHSSDPLHARGVVALLLTAVLWSTGGVFIKSLPLTPLTIAGSRSAIAAVTMLLVLRRPQPTWSVFQWGSIISYSATVILFVVATKLTTAANAIFLQYTAPIWVAVFSWVITKERLTKIDVLAILVVMSGMSVFFLDQVNLGSLTGNLIAVGSGLAFAGVALFMRAQRGSSTTESILLGNVLTAVVCLPFLSPFPLTVPIMMNLLALGVLQLGISYLLYSWALKHVSALEAILLTTLEPLLNPVWVTLFHGETPSMHSVVGGSIVVGAVVLRNVLNVSRPHKQS